MASSSSELLQPDPLHENDLAREKSSKEVVEPDDEDDLEALRMAALASMNQKRQTFTLMTHPVRTNLVSIVTVEEDNKPFSGRGQLNGPNRLPENRSPLQKCVCAASSPEGNRITGAVSSPGGRRDKFRRYDSRSEEDSWESEELSEEEVEEEVEVTATDTDDNTDADLKQTFPNAGSVKKLTDNSQLEVDDVLNVDCTKEVDEFTEFLNNFQDELSADKSKKDGGTVNVKVSNCVPGEAGKHLSVSDSFKHNDNAAAPPGRKKKKTKIVKRLVKRPKKKMMSESSQKVSVNVDPPPRRSRNSSPFYDRYPLRSPQRQNYYSPDQRRHSPSRRWRSPSGRRSRSPYGRCRSRSPSPYGVSYPARRRSRSPPMPHRRSSYRRSPYSPYRYYSPPPYYKKSRSRSPVGRGLSKNKTNPKPKDLPRGDSVPSNNAMSKDGGGATIRGDSVPGSASEIDPKSKSLPPSQVSKDKKEVVVDVAKREEEEFQERLKRLPTPERALALARRRKFSNKPLVNTEKKIISLKRVKEDASLPLGGGGGGGGGVCTSSISTEKRVKYKQHPKLEEDGDDIILSVDDNTLDMFEDDETEASGKKRLSTVTAASKRKDNSRRGFTDLREQLHRKRQRKERNENHGVDSGSLPQQQQQQQQLPTKCCVEDDVDPLEVARLEDSDDENRSNLLVKRLAVNRKDGRSSCPVVIGQRVVETRNDSSRHKKGANLEAFYQGGNGSHSEDDGGVGTISNDRQPPDWRHKLTIRSSLLNRLGPRANDEPDKSLAPVDHNDIRGEDGLRSSSSGSLSSKPSKRDKKRKKEKRRKKEKKKSKKKQRVAMLSLESDEGEHDDDNILHSDVENEDNRRFGSGRKLSLSTHEDIPSLPESDEELFAFFEKDLKQPIEQINVVESSGGKNTKSSSGERTKGSRSSKKENGCTSEKKLKDDLIMDRMRKKNEERLKRLKEIEEDKILYQ